MTVPGLARPWRAWASHAPQVAQVARHEILRLRHGRHVVGWACFILLPALAMAARAAYMALLDHDARWSATADLAELARLVRWLTLPFVTFLATAALFGNAFRAEVAERTLHHLFLQPARREVLVAGKYAGTLVALGAVTGVSWLLTVALTLAPHGVMEAMATLFSGEGLRQVAGTLVVLLLAVGAYGALFLFIGLTLRSPIALAGLLFTWETATAYLPQAFKELTLAHHLESLLPVRVQKDQVLAVVGEPTPWPAALAVLLVVTVVSLAAAGWRSRHAELAYGAAE